VVPNLATWIGRGRVTKAVSEIESIELALSAMLADTERSSLNDLFEPTEVDSLLLNPPLQFRNYMTNEVLNFVPYNASDSRHYMEAARKLYTNTSYALLIAGRGVLEQDSNGNAVGKGFDSELGIGYGNVLKRDLIKRLGTNYLPELQLDPWGELYNIFPGPWKNGPNIFRRYLDSAGSSGLPGTNSSAGVQDPLTFQATDQDTGITDYVSFPANNRKGFYIWSSGANTISGQALYDTDGTYDTPGVSYYLEQDQYLMGGGDDINNWDSGSSWGRFYN
jgi:hypothetical protein